MSRVPAEIADPIVQRERALLESKPATMERYVDEDIITSDRFLSLLASPMITEPIARRAVKHLVEQLKVETTRDDSNAVPRVTEKAMHYAIMHPEWFDDETVDWLTSQYVLRLTVT